MALGLVFVTSNLRQIQLLDGFLPENWQAFSFFREGWSAEDEISPLMDAVKIEGLMRRGG
jgi:hypothetical protein